jgi:hypothetical protein
MYISCNPQHVISCIYEIPSVVNTPLYSEHLLARARGFYPFSLEGFSTLNPCAPAFWFDLFSFIACRICVNNIGDFSFGGALWVPSLDIQDENPRSGLHWLYLAMRKASLLNDIFGDFGFSPRWKPTIFVTRVNSTNVLDEGLRIGGTGRWMNSKVKSVKQGVYQE